MAGMSERFEMRLGEDVLARVDEWRAEQVDMPSRAEAMRRLVELGLARKKSDMVNFSDGEKLILWMLRDFSKSMKIKGEVDPEFVIDVISGGHYWAPRWEMQGIFHDYQDNPNDVRFVVDVLDMWSFIEEAYEALSVKDKELLKKEAEPFGEHVRFMGFDGNYEASHIGISRFLTDKMNRFTRFKGRELNSHCPMIARYRAMLIEFEPMRSSLIGRSLGVGQLVKLLRR
jgi:uncharacterized protein